MDTFSAPHFRNDEAARKALEAILWPDGPVCPKCGVINHAYATKKPGVFRCAESKCCKDFTVTMNTVMERSHIALHKWLQAFHLMTSSKKGISAHQLHRTLDITYEAAWFMTHRIRESMRTGGLAPMGGGGKIVEADETYYGPAEKVRHPAKRYRRGRRGPMDKRPILALVERGGSVRTFHVPIADKASVHKIVTENVARESRLHTDESKLYGDAPKHFAAHETVKHTAKEYVRREFFLDENDKRQVRKIHTNSAEGYFSIFKRGMRGIYQHCAEKHLHRYLAEYDFRYNNRIALGVNDGERAARAIASASGKRLTYRQPHET
jgi:transposase-like protein